MLVKLLIQILNLRIRHTKWEYKPLKENTEEEQSLANTRLLYDLSNNRK